MAYADIQKPALSYRYEFGLDALEAAQACVEAHGFAVVKKVLSEELVEELQESVRQVLDPDGALAPGESYTHTTFVEHAPALWQLLDYEPFLRVHRLFCQSGRADHPPLSRDSTQPRFVSTFLGTLTGMDSHKAPRKTPVMF